MRQLEFTLNSGITLKFDKHYQSTTDENGRFIQWPTLVAETEVDITGSDVESLRHRYLESLDDFLLLASLGARTSTTCVGWQATDQTSVTKHFRRDVIMPDGKPKLSLREGLVSQADYEDFLATTYEAFCLLKNKRPIRGAIHALVPAIEQTMEGAFRSLFAGLEELILDFRRRENLEFVLSNSDWSLLRKHLQNAIKSWDGASLSKEQRNWLYGKLNELNRIPLQIAFSRFCERYRVDLSDLWPVFQTGKSLGLSDIRNRIVHGENLPQEALDGFWVALESLTWSLGRMVLRVLGWTVERSEVSPAFLRRHATAISALAETRSRLSELLSS